MHYAHDTQQDYRTNRTGSASGPCPRPGARHGTPAPSRHKPVPPVITAVNHRQLHVANDTQRPALNVSFNACGSFSPTSMLRQITVRDTELVLQLEKISHDNTNRMFLAYGADKFVSVHFEVKMESHKARSEYIAQVLQNGFVVDNSMYHFLGHSNSNLAQKKCILYQCAHLADTSHLLACWGNFADIPVAAKRAKRTGLLLSAMQPLIVSGAIKYDMIPDVSHSGFVFTDGCGFMSLSLAIHISRNRNIMLSGTRYIPSVVQLRYRGFKGVVAVHPNKKEKTDLLLRPSMEKFKDPQPASQSPFGIVATSLPYKLGYLNRQMIMLLSALGIQDHVFEQKQADWFHQVRTMTADPAIGLKLLMTADKIDLAMRLMDLGIADSAVQQGLKQLQKKIVNAGKKLARSGPRPVVTASRTADEQPTAESQDKLRIQVDQSRVVFGVADSVDALQYGQCFFQPTMDNQPQVFSDTYLLVGRNPCYHCGDLRVLRAVDIPELHHLKDCIVFPVQGLRPHADEMAGGDLDGDIFFVCWDPDLIPHQSRICEPLPYTGAAERPQGTIGRKDMIAYFANHRQSILGALNRCFEQWAGLNGVNCMQCVQLALLFSLGVDSVKSGQQQRIPDSLVMGDDLAAEAEAVGETRIWNRLQGLAAEFSRAYDEAILQFGSVTSLAATLDEAAVWSMLTSQDLCISENHLFHLVNTWCARNQPEIFLQMAMYIDFGQLTQEQKGKAVQAGVPRNLVYNAINQSELLSKADLEKFHLEEEGPLSWKLLGAGHAYSPEATGHVFRALTEHNKTLLVFKVQPRAQDPKQVIAVYLPDMYSEPGRYDAKNRILSFLFCNNLRKKQRFQHFQKVEFDPGRFQVFGSDLARSFVWLKHQDGRMRVSIAIQEFDSKAYRLGQLQRIRKEDLTAYEIYVVNSRTPVDRPRVFVPETVDSHTGVAVPGIDTVHKDHADGSRPAQLQGQVIPTAVQADDSDAAALLQLQENLLAGRELDEYDTHSLILQWAAANKLPILLELVQQVGVEHVLASDAMEQVLLCTARLHAGDVADQLLTMMLTAASMQHASSITRLVQLCQRCGLLKVCPTVAMSIWSGAVGCTPAVSSLLGSHLMLQLAKTAVRAASSTVGAAEVLEEILQQDEMRRMNFADLSGLLETCVLECPDRTCAISLLETIRNILLPDSYMPVTDANKGCSISQSTAAPHQGNAAMKYTKHWSFLLTLDLLAEMQEAVSALSSSPTSQSMSQVTDSATFVPSETLLWDYIMHQVNHPAIANVAKMHKSQPASTTNAFIGKQPVVLSNMSATCTEKEEDADKGAPASSSKSPGADTYSIAFAANHGGALGEGQMQPGDVVRVSAMSCNDKPVSAPDYSHYFVEGKVTAVATLHVTLELPFKPDRLTEQTWRIQKLGNVVTFERCMAALLRAVQAHKVPSGRMSRPINIVINTWVQQQATQSSMTQTSQQQSLPGCIASRNINISESGQSLAIPPTETFDHLRSCNCNDSQTKAIVAAASQVLTLIHGPPGTGKTHTIAQMLLLVMRQQDSRERQAGPILVVAQTNTAVDNVMRKLSSVMSAKDSGAAGAQKQHVGMLLRVGEPKSVSKDLQLHCLEAVKGIQNHAGFFDKKAVKAALQRARVVFTTCAGAGSSQILLQQYALVVVDEASQVIEPATLIPIVQGANQVVLVGDHKQLGPCVSSLAAQEGLSTSLFERLLQSGFTSHMLNVQYRMHPDIARWPSQQYYSGKLMNGDNTMLLKVPAPLKQPLTFQHVAGWESSGASKTNPKQADAAVALIQLLVKASEVQSADIGVITPYKAMAHLLQGKLASIASCRDTKVNTVDAFQGQEKRVILFVTVRANEMHKVGFLEDQRRLDVALTRAQNALVVLGHKQTMKQLLPHWSD